ncbi:MAG: LptA/OstA family protein [Candidatus Saccharicenans sp.]|nr:LptA/OstA family protein [Candidatus Saccharicenans sp.]
MPAKNKHRGLPSALGGAALGLLFLAVIVITGSIVYNLRNRSRGPETADSSPPAAGTYHEKFQALDFAGEKMRLSLKAEHFSVDRAGRQYLEGRVEITDRETGRELSLRADRMVLDPEKKLARAEGEVSLFSSGLRAEAGEFEYDLKEKVVRAGPVRLEKDNLVLRAGRLVYWSRSGRVELGENVSGEIRSAGERLSISGRHLIIEPDGLIISAQNFKLTAGPMFLAAGRAVLRLREKGSSLDSIDLEDGARAGYEFRAGESLFNEIDLLSDRMFFQVDRKGSTLRTARAFKMEGAGDDWRFSGDGEELELLADGSRTARLLRAARFRLRLKDSAGEEFRLGGRKADYDLSSGLLRLSDQAEADQRQFSLESDRLEFRLKDRSWSAATFNLEIHPAFFKRTPLFFEGGKPVYLSGAGLEGRADFFDLNGSVRIWQAEEFFQAEKVSLEGESGRVLMEKLKKASWLTERADGRRETLELRAERANIRPEENQAVLAGKVEMILGRLNLEADELILVFSSQAAGRLSRCQGLNRVAFSWKGYRASGRQLDFDLTEENLVLCGSPRLLTAGGERLEADKLTLHLANDRIRLENQKRERSLTILVRGK